MLFDQWDYGRNYCTNQAPFYGNNNIIRTVVPTQQCPSDTPTKTWNTTPNYNYAVNLGTTDSKRTNPLNGSPSPGRRSNTTATDNTTSAITDGTASTLMIAEVRQGQDGQDLRG